MKKSELRQLIREEINKVNETSSKIKKKVKVLEKLVSKPFTIDALQDTLNKLGIDPIELDEIAIEIESSVPVDFETEHGYDDDFANLIVHSRNYKSGNEVLTYMFGEWEQ